MKVAGEVAGAGKIYLAARYRSRHIMRDWRAMLEAAGFIVTSRWINGGHDMDTDASNDEQRHGLAMEDLEDIDAADVLVLWNPREHHGNGSGGRHVELGYALARRKPTIIVGERENVFHYLQDRMHVIPDVKELIGTLLVLEKGDRLGFSRA